MDSTNSGSIQSSSSDGDDDYDSRPEAISSFLNLPPPPPPPPPPQSSSSHHLHHHPSPSSFISLSPFFNPFPSTPPDPNPLSLDMPWAKSLPSSSSLSDPSCTITGGLTTTNSSSSTTTPSFRTMAVAAPGRSPHSDSASLNPSSVQPPTQPEQPPATPRATKKRSRASRRAPTTVLTTDTSNFRAMVQEFTGFPAAPFISSPFSRPRLDLFHATAAAAPPYLLRPFAQKVQTPLFSPISSSSSSSSMADVAAAITRNSVANANTSPTSATCSNSSSSSTTSSSNYQLLSMDLGHPNLLRSPNFTFQSPLRPPTAPNQSSSTMPTFGGNPPLGASDYAAGGLGSLITMEGTKPGGRADGFLGWDGGSASEGRDQSHLRPGIANYGNLQLVSSHAEKGSESMTAARGEGRVDSWILSSD